MIPTEYERNEWAQLLYGKFWIGLSGPECEIVLRLIIAAKQAEATRQCGIALGWIMETFPAAIKSIGKAN